MCQCNGETVDHLLLHCPMAGILWNWVFHAFGISWVIFGKVADVLFSWWNGLGRRTFEDVTSSESQLLYCFALTLFDWSRAWGFTTSTNVIEFISSLSLLCDDVII
jgi:hypothetical protein